MTLALIGPIGWPELAILLILAMIVLVPIVVAAVIVIAVVLKRKPSER